MNETNVKKNENTEKGGAFLSLRHLEKVYPNGEKAVFDFNLDIERNEFIVIVGPSGCGKSTTLKMIAGLEDISSGDIMLGDELLNYKPCKDRQMAIVFQSYALYPQMNVYDNIAFPLTINKYPFPTYAVDIMAHAEIIRVFETLTPSVAIGVLYDCLTDKELKQNSTESVCGRLGVAFDTAKLLVKQFIRIKAESRDEAVGRADEIAKEIINAAEELANVERQNLEARGVKLDDEYRELDESGEVKLTVRKMTAHEIRQKVYETAEILDLVHYLDKLPKELSGGQMQRVALGRAIVKNVPLFLMDEPLSNLDAKLRVTMRSEIVKLHNRIKATTIYVTHDQTEAMTMATRIVVMSKGYIQQIGTPKDVYDHPANIFIAKFIGSPSMNIFEMDFDRERKCLEHGELKIGVDSDFIKCHDEFYSDKLEQFNRMTENFDAAARDELLKLMSATGEGKKAVKHKKKQRFELIRKFIAYVKSKRSNNATAEDPLLEILRKKREQLVEFSQSSHKLLVGIRPERVQIEKYNPNKKYKTHLVVKPTVCELLGSEYNVHFDFCGKNMIGKIDAKHTITVNDEIAVSFSFEDVYLFDPVTGEIIVNKTNR